MLGKVSCGAFSESLTACKDNNRKNKGVDPCLELNQLTRKCFSAKNKDEVNSYILAEFNEAAMLHKFLALRNSAIPAKLA